MSERIDELLNLIKDHRVFIQTHNFPDPDAIASAFALQYFLKQYGVSSCICHHGNIERTSTEAMVTLLGIDMTRANELDDITDEDYIITIDSQKGNSNLLDLPGEEVVCIDHHPIFNSGYYRFTDIRRVGSCSTIIADYYRENGIEMPEKVATALLYGLKTDTMDFTRGVTAFDIEIFAYLFGLADNSLIRKLQASTFRYDELDAFIASMVSMKIENGVAYSFIDFDCTDSFVAIVSDFILSLDTVFFSVVYSSRGSGLKFSVRSEIDKLDAGVITANALSSVGNGGGHNCMAGGYAEKEWLLAIDKDLETAISRLFNKAIDDFCSR